MTSRLSEPLEDYFKAAHGGDTLVIASVSGTFPGSPITLQYEFKVDGRRIIGLEIG